jgi:hypothetical protein
MNTNKKLIVSKEPNSFGKLEVLGFEPYFNSFVKVGSINHEKKIIRPSFGYFAPHKYGKRLKAKAKKLNYTFIQ